MFMNKISVFLAGFVTSILPLVFWEFFKIGLFAVGGGFATIPFLYSLTHIFPLTVMDISDMIAVATVLPGPIGVSCAAFTGWKIAGFWGGFVAPLGLVTPSVIVIVLVAKLFMQIKENKYVKYVFYCLRPAVCGLIAACAYTFLKNGTLTDKGINYKIPCLFALALASMLFVKKIKIHPIAYIFAGAVIGIVFRF